VLRRQEFFHLRSFFGFRPQALGNHALLDKPAAAPHNASQTLRALAAYNLMRGGRSDCLVLMMGR